jgi:hypothetical protein
VPPALAWTVRAGRGRPDAARWGLVLWLAVSALLIAFGPRGLAVLLVALGVYLVGPLWVPVSYRIDNLGVRRATPFGERTWAWETLGEFGFHARERSAWLAPRGRGVARFLPPILLLWEEREGTGFRASLEAALAARLGRDG